MTLACEQVLALTPSAKKALLESMATFPGAGAPREYFVSDTTMQRVAMEHVTEAFQAVPDEAWAVRALDSLPSDSAIHAQAAALLAEAEESPDAEVDIALLLAWANASMAAGDPQTAAHALDRAQRILEKPSVRPYQWENGYLPSMVQGARESLFPSAAQGESAISAQVAARH